jgi:predicted phosphodiesterase
MPGKEGLSAKVAREYLGRFPKAGTRTVAIKLWKEQRRLWPSFNACYLICRRLRGKHGEYHRKGYKQRDQTLRQPMITESYGFPKLPEALTELVDWKAEQIDDTGSWLVIGDIHIPYHDLGAIRVCLRHAKKRKVAGILLNGDLCDNYALSWFQRDPRKKDFPQEIRKIREFLWALRDAFPKARIVWRWGNHCERYDSYMQVKCPEFLGLADWEFGKVIQIEQYGVEEVKDKRPVKLGKLWTLHGHEYRGTWSTPVNAARTLFLKARVSTMCGHFHKTSQHSQKDLNDDVVSCWSHGCLCSMRPEWLPLNDWNHGAAFVEISQGGAYEVDNFRIINGEKWS